MRTHFTSIFTLVALLATLIGSAVYVTPVRAASIVVNTNVDNRADDGFCTLREAIIAAVGNFSSGVKAGECAAGSTGVDSISFAGNYTITVDSQLPYVTTAMTITGKGATNTIIQAADRPNVATWRLFQVTETGTLTLDGVTVRNGQCWGSCTILGAIYPNAGGGVYNRGALAVTNSTFSGNIGEAGGGILNEGIMSLTNSTFAGNNGRSRGSSGDYGYGGGIFNSGTLTVTNSAFSGNTAWDKGGGILNEGALTVTNSTFSGNATVGGGGGGIFNSSTLTVANSTFSGNTSGYSGGGIYNDHGTLTVMNSTISGNTASNEGGGISNDSSATATLKNTIVANNNEGKGNCYGPIINGGFNLDGTTTCGWGMSNGSLSNTDPKLGALMDNGGPTQTMKLLAGSPAIDKGNGSTCGASPVNGVDQRGVSRPLGNGCDIGAYETSNGEGPDTAGVFRPSNGLLYLKNLNITGFADIAINYGVGGDYPVVGDWDGNGTATIGIYRNGSFYLRNSNTIGFADLVFSFGAPGDQPIAGDWDGNGTDTIGVYRPSTGAFFLRNSNITGAPDITFFLGNVGDVGIAGDWNSDGIDTTGVFRPSNGIIFLKNSNTTGFADIALNYGIPGDRPVTGDWNDDGIDTIGIYRGNNFYLRNSNTIGFADIVFALGIPGDMPIVGNWDAAP